MAHDLLWFLEVLEVLVVSADTDRMLRPKEKWAATFEAENYSKKLLIMGIIVDFGREEAA
jgi:hypothetical protein